MSIKRELVQIMKISGERTKAKKKKTGYFFAVGWECKKESWGRCLSFYCIINTQTQWLKTVIIIIAQVSEGWLISAGLAHISESLMWAFL